MDQDAFYEEIDKLNYDGVDRYQSSPTKRLVKHHKHTVEHKGKFLKEHQHPSEVGVQYSGFNKAHIVEPADGKGLNYKLIEKKPLKFFDQVLEQDVIKKKVAKDKQAALDVSHVRGRKAERDRVMGNVKGTLKYEEKVEKRLATHCVEQTKQAIAERHEEKRSCSRAGSRAGSRSGSPNARAFNESPGKGALVHLSRANEMGATNYSP